MQYEIRTNNNIPPIRLLVLPSPCPPFALSSLRPAYDSTFGLDQGKFE